MFSQCNIYRKGKGRISFAAIIQRGIDPRKVEFFITLFDSAASCIQRGPSRDVHDSLHYNKITGKHDNHICQIT
jgi:hypothetical protein